MLMLYLMIFMIDHNNSYADISEITATAVSIGVFSSGPYSLLNKEQVPYSLFDLRTTYFQNIFMQLLYAMILMIDPCNSYADISEIIATAVSFGKFSSVPYSELNKE
jgi:hypothetical protein